MTAELRCPSCHRLLAKWARLPGVYEVRQGKRHLVEVKEGRVVCVQCRVGVEIPRLELREVGTR